MTEEHPLLTLAKKVRYDLDAARAKQSELIRALAAANLAAPHEFVCPHCHLTLGGKLPLAEHVYHTHGGPEPEHWKEAERLASTEEV